MARSGREMRGEAWVRGVLVLVPLLVFTRALPFDFVRSWDDGRFILDNTDVQKPSWQALGRMFSRVQFEAYHPLHLVSYWLDVPWITASGAELASHAWVLHTVSLVLWIAALWQVFAVARALAVPEWAALAATLACGVHPCQVEVVSWATGRKDVLALLFVASSLRLQLTAASTSSTSSTWSPRAHGARALYVAALLSKTTALPLPLFGLCLDVLVRKRRLREALLWQLPSLLIAAATSALVITIWDDHAMLRQTVGGSESALVRISQTLGHQLASALWPSASSPLYATHSITHWAGLRTTLCLGYLGACVLAAATRRGLLLAGLLGFGVFLAPAANVVPMYFPLQDRYASLPIFALSLAAADLLAAASVRRWQLQAAAAAAVLVLGARTWQYSGEWQNEPRLWGHAVSTQPDADYAYLKLGEARRDAGQLEGAIKAYHAAIARDPRRVLAHAGLFEAVARRDERIQQLAPSRARSLAQQYYQRINQPQTLPDFASQLWASGYRRASELPLQTLLALQPRADNNLSFAALAAIKTQRESLARYYVHELQSTPTDPLLVRVLQQPYYRVAPSLPSIARDRSVVGSHHHHTGAGH
ncbi:MAG: hypothetical protein ABW321_30255 [Polyangiales bacterium]